MRIGISENEDLTQISKAWQHYACCIASSMSFIWLQLVETASGSYWIQKAVHLNTWTVLEIANFHVPFLSFGTWTLLVQAPRSDFHRVLAGAGFGAHCISNTMGSCKDIPGMNQDAPTVMFVCGLLRNAYHPGESIFFCFLPPLMKQSWNKNPFSALKIFNECIPQAEYCVQDIFTTQTPKVWAEEWQINTNLRNEQQF